MARNLAWGLIGVLAASILASLAETSAVQHGVQETSRKLRASRDSLRSAQGTTAGPRELLPFGGGARKEDCAGRRLYLLDLGEQFHRDLLYGASGPDPNHQRLSAANGGYGPERHGRTQRMLGMAGGARDDDASDDGIRASTVQSGGNSSGNLPACWFNTWPNALDVVFHSRALRHACRVDSAAEADVIYVVYYGSLDVSRSAQKDAAARGRLGRELASLLAQQPSFQKKGGRDHFLVLGRPFWDFHANLRTGFGPGWGNDLMRLEPLKEVQIVSIERPGWMGQVLAAPYPTSFHPRDASELHEWMDLVKGRRRPWLFAFAGARRGPSTGEPVSKASVARDAIFWQCEESRACKLVDCNNPRGRCEHDWTVFTRLYLSSSFCIHPRGDSCTRRAVLDSMLAGCIPVLLEKCSVDEQYTWLLGRAGEYSVFVNRTLLQTPPGLDGAPVAAEGEERILLEDVLQRIPEDRVKSMRLRIMELIPRLVFGGQSTDTEGILGPDFKDAFEYTLEQVARHASG